MAGFTKHVAQHNQRKCVVAFRQVPDEAHMALVVYTDDLPAQVHDELIKAVDSEPAQATPDLADVLHRTTMSDNRNLLDVLHNEHRIKKVPTNQVLLTPNVSTKQRLDEVNTLLADIKAGNEAAQKAKALDENQGMAANHARAYNRGRDVGEPPAPMETVAPPVINAPDGGVLSNEAIATNLLEQAKAHETNAKGLMAEAKRLKEEAKGLNPNVKSTTTRKKTTRTKKQTA